MGFGGIRLSDMAQDCLIAVGAPAVPALNSALKHQDPQVRARAADALSQIGPGARAAVPGLTSILDDETDVIFQVGCMGYNRTVGERGMLALAAVGQDAKSSIPRLLDLLKRETLRPHEPDAQQERLELVVSALGAIGPAAHAAVPQLTEFVRRDESKIDSSARAACVAALARIAPDSPAVIPGLQWLFAEVRQSGPKGCSYWSQFSNAMEALVAMGERGKTLLPNLQETFDECPLLHSHFRCEAAFAAARLDPSNKPAVRFLEWASRHADRMIWERAKKKLDRLQKAVRVDSDER